MNRSERARTSENERERARTSPTSPRRPKLLEATSARPGTSANVARRGTLAALSAFAAFAALTALTTGCSSSSENSGSGATTGAGRATFAPVQNERFAVTTAELSAILLDNQKYARWTFGLKLKQPIQLRSIRIEDITEGTPAPLVNDQAPQVEGGAWTGYTGAIEPTASALPWLFDSSPAKRTFRFTVTDLNGQDSVLEQTVTYTVKSKKDLIKWYGFSA